MKAFVYERYGSPDVLQLKELERPALREGELLIEVMAASVNPCDWHAMRGEPFLQRLESGFLHPRDQVLGADVAGRVKAVGKNVTGFQAGDEVYGDLYYCGFGAFAEYATVPEESAALKPANLTFEAAAAVPQAAFTALRAVRDQGQVQPGQQVLINGASGGVGTFALQIAKSFGAEVTAVCSARNSALVRSIGADHVINYAQENFTQNGQRYDLIVDMVANHSLTELKRVMKPNGNCVVVGFSTMAHMLKVSLFGPLISMTGRLPGRQTGKQVGMLMPEKDDSDLVVMKELLEAGKVVPVIDRRYPFGDIPEAIRYLEQGHARGKVVITL